MTEKFYYPLYFKSKNGLIIRFDSIETGTVIALRESSDWKIGDYHNKWIPHTKPYWTEISNPNIRRNLAFYKRLGGIWTKAESIKISEYCGDTDINFDEESILKKRYFYDNGNEEKSFMYPWNNQHKKTINECQLLCYEDIFPINSKDIKLDTPKDNYKLGSYAKQAIQKAKDAKLFSELRKLDQKLKENIVKNTTVEIKVNGKNIKLEDSTPDIPKTELEESSKYVTHWFNSEEDYSHKTIQSPKQATKELQNPKMLGYTFITYKKVASRTTDIPTKKA